MPKSSWLPLFLAMFNLLLTMLLLVFFFKFILFFVLLLIAKPQFGVCCCWCCCCRWFYVLKIGAQASGTGAVVRAGCKGVGCGVGSALGQALTGAGVGVGRIPRCRCQFQLRITFRLIVSVSRFLVFGFRFLSFWVFGFYSIIFVIVVVTFAIWLHFASFAF